jgi:hypothetical protein
MPKKTNSPTIKIRRAVPEDVVNIFKQTRNRAETEKPHFLGVPDNHRGMAFILDLIQNGYVIVADLSGRIVGCLGCSVYEIPYLPKDSWVMDAEFIAFAPGFEDNGTGAALLQNLRKFVLENKVPLRVMTCKVDEDRFGKFLGKIGFEQVGTVHVLRVDQNEHGRQEDEDDPDGGVASVDGAGGPKAR